MRARGVCLSEDAHRQVRDRLEENFVDLGERQLKNIARPVRAYSLPAAAIAGSKDQGTARDAGERPSRRRSLDRGARGLRRRAFCGGVVRLAGMDAVADLLALTAVE